jgi:BirA family biotin operon repressor/biotin-[acetyl-CoA-carboxylase] ligase
VLVELHRADPPAPSLALLAGLALVEALKALRPPVEATLKWPNDVLLGDSKFAGILLERTGDRVVAGFGINLATAPTIEGRRTTSLDGATTPEAFAPLLAGCFDRLLAEWRRSGTGWLVDAWQAAATPLGTPLTVHESDGHLVSGRFAGIDRDGALRLALDGGEERIIRAGDVSLSPPSQLP